MPETIVAQCKICEAPAFRSNYGVLTCNSCKIFFRRNATKEQKNFRCYFDGNCEINVNSRHTCTYCRLAKCFANGMQLDRIRGPRLSKRSDKPQQIKPSELNLIYNYDEQKLLSIAQEFLNQSDNVILANEFFRNLYATSGEYIRSNGDLRTLSPDDRSVFLRNLADNITCLGMAMISTWTSLCQSRSFINIGIQLYGVNSVSMIQRILKFIDPDIIIGKLTISLFAFSNNMSIFISPMNIKSFNTLAILRIQNIYAELTWKYLVYKYGYIQSIQRFNNLIQCLLAATMTVSDVQTIDKHTNDLRTLIEQIELTLVLDDIERVGE